MTALDIPEVPARLVFANGCQAYAFSAEDPDSLRGPQFDAAWADELAKWKKSEDVWDMLQFALRLGDNRSRWSRPRRATWAC